MEKRPDTNIQEQHVKMAALWFARLRAPDLSAGEKARFKAWLESDPACRLAYRGMEKTWEETGILLAPAKEGDKKRSISLTDKVKGFLRPARSLVSPVGILAFCLALFSMAIVKAPDIRHWYQGSPQVFVTANTEHKTLELEDGTRVEMNAGTRIIIKMGRGARRVSLERGEAFFRVAPKAGKKFEVEAGRGRVIVLGTRFNVKKRNGHVAVDVQEGRVRVRTAPDRDISAPGLAVIQRGQGVDYRVSGHMDPVRPSRTDQVNAWRNNRIFFSATPLWQVAGIMERQFDIRLVFPGPMLRTEQFTGTFGRDDPNAILEVLATAFSMELNFEDLKTAVFTDRK